MQTGASPLVATRLMMVCLALAVAGCGHRESPRALRFKGATSVLSPIGAFPYPQPTPGDRRIPLIKEKLRQQGYRVVDAFFDPAKDGVPAMLGATVEADYTRPSVQGVLLQAFNTWDVLYISLGNDINAPETDRWFLVAGQYWTKYVLYLYVSVHDVRTYMRKVLAVQGRPQKARPRAQALEQLLDTVQFKVFDTERRQSVDEKEFQDKHFVDD